MTQNKTLLTALYVIGASCLIGLWSNAGFAQSSANSDVIIEADEMLEWNQSEKYYLAVGNAYVVRGNQSIKAAQIKAFYNSEEDGSDITHVVAQGDVQLNEGARTATGEWLDYDAATGAYQMAGSVRLNEGARTAKGDKLNYDATTGAYLLTGSDLEVISADGQIEAHELLEFSAADNRQHAVGNAKITLSDGRIVQADDIVVQNLPDGTVDQIDATGNVIITIEKNRRAEADNAIYTQKTNTALLDGDVTISEDGNILNGQRAEIDFNTGINRMLASSRGRVKGILRNSANQ